MAKGNRILVKVPDNLELIEGIIDDTSKPGTIMQLVAASADVSGRYHYKAAAPGTDGLDVEPIVLLEDLLQGKTTGDAYASGDRIRMAPLRAGDEANLRVGEVAGTGNTFAIGDKLIIDAEDGILVPYAATPQALFAVSMEALTQQSGSVLLWCRKS